MESLFYLLQLSEKRFSKFLVIYNIKTKTSIHAPCYALQKKKNPFWLDIHVITAVWSMSCLSVSQLWYCFVFRDIGKKDSAKFFIKLFFLLDSYSHKKVK